VLEEYSEVLVLLRRARVYQDVYVSETENEPLQDLVHEPLERLDRVSQAEGHERKLE
jgi:hypothetical protein